MAPKIRLVVLAGSTVMAIGLGMPGEAAAQPRVVHGPVVVRPAYGYYYPRYYYPPFWGGYGYGYGGFGFGFGYGYGPYYPYPYPYYGGVYDLTGAARLQVSPKQTEVFIDGYLVGTVDDFDGTLQRLRVDAGEHELALYLEGYKTVRTPVLFRREGTIAIKQVMQPLAPGETSERPVPTQPPPAARGYDEQAQYAPAPYRVRPDNRVAPSEAAPGTREDYGTLAIRVQPAAAEILIDGERWDGSDNGSRLNVDLIDGPHRVEVRSEGYRPYTANVRVRRGQTETLNISLTK